MIKLLLILCNIFIQFIVLLIKSILRVAFIFGMFILLSYVTGIEFMGRLMLPNW